LLAFLLSDAGIPISASLAGGRVVDLFQLCSWCLVVVFGVTLIWPVNILLVALAFKVRQGGKPIDMEAGEYWFRCTFAALGLAVLSLATVAVEYALVCAAEMPPGPVQCTLLLLYVPAAVGFFFWIFGLDDLMHASSVFALYIILSSLPVLIIGRIAHVWQKLHESAPWLWSLK